jgi:superfamily II DNA/RNA helicase
MELFAAPKKRKAESEADGGSVNRRTKAVSGAHDKATAMTASNVRSFAELGLCEWICKSTSAMGFKKPFDIQKACIPSIIAGRDVMGCAETGSGKTAAFALPILQHLSQDPYGIFAIVLTPTRELVSYQQPLIQTLSFPRPFEPN